MPIYEFYCDDCGNRFEELASAQAADNGEIACLKCNSQKVRRLLSSFSFSSSGASPSTLGKSSCGGCDKSSCSGCG